MTTAKIKYTIQGFEVPLAILRLVVYTVGRRFECKSMFKFVCNIIVQYVRQVLRVTSVQFFLTELTEFFILT